MTADGFFPPDRWRVGESVRDRFTMPLPADWKGTGVAFGLFVADPTGIKLHATGDHPANDATVSILGAMPLVGGAQPPGIVPVPMAPVAPPAPAGSGSSAAARP
jgi:hypothetical protein